jgi:hypothetical protein
VWENGYIKEHFGYLSQNGIINEHSVNTLRFSLVKLLNEYENMILLVNNRTVDCEQVFDILRSFLNEFKGLDQFVSEYDDDKFKKSAQNSLNKAPIEAASWDVAVNFNNDALKILKNNHSKTVSAAQFCFDYHSSRLPSSRTAPAEGD